MKYLKSFRSQINGKKNLLAKNSNARKETVDIDNFLKFKNDDRKIIQPIGKKSRTPTIMKEEQPYQPV